MSAIERVESLKKELLEKIWEALGNGDDLAWACYNPEKAAELMASAIINRKKWTDEQSVNGVKEVAYKDALEETCFKERQQEIALSKMMDIIGKECRGEKVLAGNGENIFYIEGGQLVVAYYAHSIDDSERKLFFETKKDNYTNARRGSRLFFST